MLDETSIMSYHCVGYRVTASRKANCPTFQDIDSDGSWIWEDGASVSYTNWNSGEPNGDHERNCAGMYKSNGRWDDFSCTNQIASVCRTIIQYTATTTGCPCSFDATRNDCACCYSGGCHCGADYADRCVGCGGDCTSDEVEPLEEWTLVFKHIRSSGINIRDLWQGGDTYNDGSTDAQIVTSTSAHYKSSTANHYDTNQIQYVKLAFYTSGGSEVMSMTFNAANTNKNSWFSYDALLYAPYSDIYTASKGFFSMDGDYNVRRCFFACSYYNGCGGDAGWIMIKDTGYAGPCTYDSYYNYPYFTYNTAGTLQAFQSGHFAFPEILAIFYKYYDTSTNQGICDDDWDLGNSGRSCYRVVDSTVTWQDALDACRGLRSNADLVSIANADENAFVLTMSRRTLTYNEYWIGLNDFAVEGTWEWSDGTYSTYTNWASSEPNDSSGKEHCSVMRWSTDGSWNDANCANSKRYICEYPLNVISCAEWKRQGYTSSGYYTIDPDGPAFGNDPFRIYCDMTSDGNTGITVINHNQEMRQWVKGYESSRSYIRSLSYRPVSVSQASAVADISGECYQHIKIECYGMSMNSGYHTAWYTRDGSMATYWGGAPSSTSLCACGYQGNCDGGYSRCNCEVNDYNWRLDEGYLTDKNDLPVTEIRVGDTGDGSEQAYHTIGALYCKYDESTILTDRTDFVATVNAYISGNNQETITSTTISNCASQCVACTSFLCVSFDFNLDTNNCYLSTETDETVGLSYSTSAVFYKRKFQRQENPNRESNNCPSGWAEYNSHCYYAGVSSKTWYDAEIYCETNGGGALVSVDDDAEHEFLTKIGRWANPSTEYFWIGTNDIEVEGLWVNVDQSNTTYSRWRSGEPNGDAIENGVLMSVYTNYDWIDVGVDGTYHFFCEATVGASAIPAPTTHPLCPSGWFHDDHSCYSFSGSATSWDGARSACQSSNADLAIIDTMREFNFLLDLWRYRYSTQRFWVGLTDSASEGDFLWLNDDAFSLNPSVWDTGSPDDAGSNEDCVEFNTNRKLNDADCSASLYYICEDDLYPVARPENFNVEVKSTKEVEITWDTTMLAGAQDHDIAGFRIYYWVSDQMSATQANFSVESSVRRYILSTLMPGISYEFTLTAFTTQGEGPSVDPPVEATTQAAVIRTDTRRLKVYVIQRGQRLRQHALSDVQMASFSQCTNACTADESCLSVNFHEKSRSALKTCELNGDTHTGNAGDMEADREYIYASVEGY
ncbi:macrophage mannose receptor 1-like isoform X2 [Acanthaster planci]|uniref:Macrophage mannose receptor 1-like isoform X2 n=1 Tax=Acanthaster planci TaxID=133434 RepID=A0A8B7Y0I1_ACAPL|nr:macrophage mannose receptor 1-like isoform X2 [Acanthaster planci]